MVFFGKRLVVALLNGCALLGILAVLALGDVHNVFGILDVLAFGDIHTFGNVHAIFGILARLNLSILALLVVVWRGMVIVASCKRQHDHLIVAWESLRSSLAFVWYCHCSSRYDKK
jgi:hypothetical protein